MNKQIGRLRAEEDLRQLRLLASVSAEEAYRKTLESLQEQVGEIVVVEETRRELNLDENGRDPAFDRGAFEALRAKFGRKRK